MSGVKISEECKDRLEQVKTKKRMFTVWKIGNDNHEIVPDEDCDSKKVEDFKSLQELLPTDKGFYIIFDYPIGNVSMPILVARYPKQNIAQKMLFASCYDTLKKTCTTTLQHFECDSDDGITDEVIQAKLSKQLSK